MYFKAAKLDFYSAFFIGNQPFIIKYIKKMCHNILVTIPF